jgi:DNA-binding GntR family transcriptional regulator
MTVVRSAAADGRTLELLPTRASAAYDEIKRRIIELELAPGCVFTEADIAANLGVSKTPAREALARLNGEGLVQVVPRSGYRVAPVTLKMARDLFDLRDLLEVEAVGAAAGRLVAVDTLAALQQMRVTTYYPNNKLSVRTFLQANTEFHVRLARAGGNDAIADVLGHLFNQLERLFHLGITLNAGGDEVVHDHNEVLDAVINGDVEQARQVTRAEVAHARGVVLDALMSSDVILSANVVPSPKQVDDRR